MKEEPKDIYYCGECDEGYAVTGNGILISWLEHVSKLHKVHETKLNKKGVN